MNDLVMKRKRGIPLELPKGFSFNVRSFARQFASAFTTNYSKKYVHNIEGATNPALQAASYESSDEFKHDYACYNLIRKLNDESLVAANIRSENAFKKFMAVEQGLASINDNLNWRDVALTKPEQHHILWRAQKKISKLLGPLVLDNIFELSSFSHGASALHKRTEGRAEFKYSFEYPEVTPACYKLAECFIRRSPVWSETVKGFTLVEGNRLTTVPKDSDIDRVIACEPTMNMFIQKGIGMHIRKCLKAVGIDLLDQSINQELARQGSLTNDLATVDLSAASDSISIALCKLILPEAWYDILLTTRCDQGTLPDGTLIRYQKISSMGNGFTFELETMLFWAITQACEDIVSETIMSSRHYCSVYGDDIVCRSLTVPLLRTVLNTCGFSLNDDKSFWDGPFRESCGKHFHNGHDVSPFFIRRPVDNLADLIGLCNRLRRWATWFNVWDPRYEGLHRKTVRRLPVFWQQARIPDGFGDGALIGTLAEVQPDFRRGIHKAFALVERELVCMPNYKDYLYLSNIFLGIGGYTNSLKAFGSGFDQEDRDRMTAGAHSEHPPIPGSCKTTLIKVKLYEWPA